MNLETPLIIPVFIPHRGCPHQCIFCNQISITGMGAEVTGPEKINQQVKNFLGYKRKNRKNVQIAFYGGNFLGLSESTIRSLLDEAAGFVKRGAVNSIRFSTRPDTIDKARLDLITDFPVSTIELGVQSMNDRVLVDSNRGHSARDTEKAVRCLKERGYDIGLQMMVGLPGDDGSESLTTAYRIASLSPDFVRIYPTVVLAGSPLAVKYKNGDYRPLGLEKCVALVRDIYNIFKKNNIKVARMGLQDSEDLADSSVVLAGPYHPAFGHLVYSRIFFDMASAWLKEEKQAGHNVIIRVHPRNISRMRGMKNSNVRALKKAFEINRLDVLPDKNLPEDKLMIERAV